MKPINFPVWRPIFKCMQKKRKAKQTHKKMFLKKRAVRFAGWRWIHFIRLNEYGVMVNHLKCIWLLHSSLLLSSSIHVLHEMGKRKDWRIFFFLHSMKSEMNESVNRVTICSLENRKKEELNKGLTWYHADTMWLFVWMDSLLFNWF